MKRLFMVSLLLLVGGFIMSGISAAKVEGAEKKGKPQTICPVMGDPIDKKYYVDYKGYRIYFCCSSCPDDFKKNPEKYIKILKDSGVTLEKAPKGHTKGAPAKGTMVSMSTSPY
jgi:YHS domain-containing protein